MPQELVRPDVVGPHDWVSFPHTVAAHPACVQCMDLVPAISYADEPRAMELNQIEAFVAIVRGGGFTRASATLHLSQPAISRRLHLLEDELGAPLFERIRSGAVLTEAGRAFLPHAETLLACMRDARDAVAALHAAERGTVTLALVGTLASTPLTVAL